MAPMRTGRYKLRSTSSSASTRAAPMQAAHPTRPSEACAAYVPRSPRCPTAVPAMVTCGYIAGKESPCEALLSRHVLSGGLRWRLVAAAREALPFGTERGGPQLVWLVATARCGTARWCGGGHCGAYHQTAWCALRSTAVAGGGGWHVRLRWKAQGHVLVAFCCCCCCAPPAASGEVR